MSVYMMQLGSIVGDGNFEVATKKITPNSYKTIELVKKTHLKSNNKQIEAVNLMKMEFLIMEET